MALETSSRHQTRNVDENSPASEIIAWSFERFARQGIVMTTSFGMEGCCLIDLCAAQGRPLTVIYLDTMFFFEETYRLRDRMVERYPHVNFVNRGTDLTPAQQAEKHGDALWETNPDLCCKLRKVYPMREAIEGADVWITGLRRSQSATRADMKVIEWDWQYQLLKINPLANWERRQVWEYVESNGVPYNGLHEKGYPTVGCTHCTQPVDGHKIGDYSRAGRWNGTNKTECGLHGYGI